MFNKGVHLVTQCLSFSKDANIQILHQNIEVLSSDSPATSTFPLLGYSKTLILKLNDFRHFSCR